MDRKQSERNNPAFKVKELLYQRKSEQNSRKEPLVQECERIRQQQNRQQKRKLEDESDLCIISIMTTILK